MQPGQGKDRARKPREHRKLDVSRISSPGEPRHRAGKLPPEAASLASIRHAVNSTCEEGSLAQQPAPALPQSLGLRLPLLPLPLRPLGPSLLRAVDSCAGLVLGPASVPGLLLCSAPGWNHTLRAESDGRPQALFLTPWPQALSPHLSRHSLLDFFFLKEMLPLSGSRFLKWRIAVTESSCGFERPRQSG